jgi:hypothetical protein
MATTAASYVEPELTSGVDLCNDDGTLNRAAVGWSRHPLHRCNLPATLARKKKWNYWAVTTNDLLFSTTIADVDRAQIGGFYFFDRRTQRHIDSGIVVPSGTSSMPEGLAGSMNVERRDASVALNDEGTGTRILVHADDFGGEPLRADILVERPDGHETLNVVIPWSDVEFQFTSKQNTLPASGYILLGDERFDLASGAFGCLDYGRGFWPEYSIWNWGSASGVQQGYTIGLNLGGKWTDGTGMNENALCIDGRLTKLSEDLAFEYNRGDWMKPWRVRTTASDRVDLVFEPEFDRASKSGRRESYFTEAHQLFGCYRGRIKPDDGGVVEVRGLFGWIEEHEARW